MLQRGGNWGGNMLIQKYGRYYTGGIFQFTYSPKGLDVLDRYDAKPLALFINYDSDYRLCSMINLHWLTIEQRRQLMNLITYKYPDIATKAEFGNPIPFGWEHIKTWFPIGSIAWRRYFPNRIRSVTNMAPTWSKTEIEAIINTDTEKIIGVTPAVIQKRLQDTQARKVRAANQRHREAINKAQRQRSKVAQAAQSQLKQQRKASRVGTAQAIHKKKH
jgi:hypothetical protein